LIPGKETSSALIGLSSDIMILMREDLLNALKVLLADEYALYFKAHGYHWNVESKMFSQYHEFYAEIAEDVYGAIDPTAENIRKLGGYAPYKMSRMMELCNIPETEVGSDCESMKADLLIATNMIITTVNKAFDIAEASREQGIADFLASRDDMHKKYAWQLRASMA